MGRRLASLLILVISISITSVSSATLITEGSTEIIGNNPTYDLFVGIDYAIYDGTSSTDPKGITDDIQIALTLTNSSDSDLTFGRLTVFAPEPDSLAIFYISATTANSYIASSPGTRAPRLVKYHPQTTPTLPNCVEFIFDSGMTGGYLPLFDPGEVSKQLILRTSSANLGAEILLEIDQTNAGSGGCDGEVFILIPEPCSLVLFGGACLFALRRFRKK